MADPCKHVPDNQGLCHICGMALNLTTVRELLEGLSNRWKQMGQQGNVDWQVQEVYVTCADELSSIIRRIE